MKPCNGRVRNNNLKAMKIHRIESFATVQESFTFLREIGCKDEADEMENTLWDVGLYKYNGVAVLFDEYGILD